MWYNTSKPEIVLNNDSLEANIFSTGNRITVISGPSWCGKTYFLKHLKRQNTVVIPMWEIMDIYLELIIKDLSHAFSEVIEGYLNGASTICIDDVDFRLNGNAELQEKLSNWLCSVIKTRTVILAGIDVEARCRSLLSGLPSEECIYYAYIKEGQES